MAAPAHQQLLLQAVDLLPQAAPDFKTVLERPGRLFIAIESHDEPFDFANPVADSLIWLKARQNLQLRKVYAAYRGRAHDSADAVLMVDENTAVPENGIIGDLPEPTKGVLLLRAVKAKPGTAPEAPSHNSISSPRQPLQAVTRQLSATAHHSQDSMPVKRERSSTPSTQPPPQPRMTGLLPATTSVPSHSPSAHSCGMSPDLALPTAQTAPLSAGASIPAVPKQDPLQEPTSGPAFALEVQPEPEPEYQPREQKNLFAASQEDPEPLGRERGIPLTQLANDETTERLEAGVQAGLKVLSELETPLIELGVNEDAQVWLKQIEKVRKEAIQTRTVVGVVGNTGAGKSSVINAMLDEERLVPTNCMRACTAVVTELSYNYNNQESAKYRAEIEFIKPEDWRKELNVLFQEVFEDGQISREISNPDSEAGVAYAKIRAVYNKKTREMLANSTIESLMSDKKVKSVLGTTRKISSPDATSFYERLQKIIDSKEKGQEKLDKNGNINHHAKREFEHWPLIRVVKIYIKSPALSTGAVIVDLPGVHDSNAARAAVAEGYMKQCTGLWIVAPINRAVDDKAAKNLLGDTFKRQLKFDGTYSAVTFICSKTDDISRTEAADSLQLGHEMTQFDEKLSDISLRRRELKKEQSEADEKIKDLEAAGEDLEDVLEVWDKLLDQAESGKTVYAPDQSKKRKSASTSTPPRKRHRRAIDSDDENERDRIEEQDADHTDQSTATTQEKQSLTVEAIEEKIDELKQLKKETRREKNSSRESKSKINDSLLDLEDEEAEIEAKKSAICIAGRNEYSRGAIQQDFAQGIRDLDMENAEEDDPDAFNPDEDLRDYDEVARTLPVFCVSSRAYQKLSGRMKKDSPVPGFTTIEQTEIPQLQAHCKNLTVKGRQANCRRFLNSVKQLLLSLALWSSDDGTGSKLTSQQRDVENQFLSRRLKDLEKLLEKVVEDTLKDAVDELHEQLFTKLDPVVNAAIQEAEPKAESWGLPRPAGGLHFMTYRATVRRAGVYHGSAGPRDFNAELTEPIYKNLATVWEKVFQRRLPNILQAFKRQATTVVKQFHAAIETRTRERGTGAARLNLLSQQLDQYSATFDDLCSSAVASLNEGQREINREFVPAITMAMEPAYDSAASEFGIGSFKRMKGHIGDHVSRSKQQMFQSASQQVRQSLLKLCKNIKESMLTSADAVYVQMHRDYTSVVNGSAKMGDIKLSREERLARREVDQVISAADEHFQRVLDSESDGIETNFKVDKEEDQRDDFMDVDDLQDTEEENGGDADNDDEASERHEDDADSRDGTDGPAAAHEQEF